MVMVFEWYIVFELIQTLMNCLEHETNPRKSISNFHYWNEFRRNQVTEFGKKILG